MAPTSAHAVAVGETQDNCSWDRPGHNPYTGKAGSAIDRYTDIPVATRTRLKERLQAHQYDEVVSIGRDSISGAREYDARIRDMHFGASRVCGQVSRAGWSPSHRERGLVYCEQGQCVLVPDICQNVSRIHRTPELSSAPAGGAAGPGGAPVPFAAPLAAPPLPGSVAAAPSDIPGTVAGGSYLLRGPIATGPTPYLITPGPAGVIPEAPYGPGIPLAPVPEPASWMLLLAGLGAFAIARRAWK